MFDIFAKMFDIFAPDFTIGARFLRSAAEIFDI
jgi:hypothetical protein